MTAVAMLAVALLVVLAFVVGVAVIVFTVVPAKYHGWLRGILVIASVIGGVKLLLDRRRQRNAQT